MNLICIQILLQLLRMVQYKMEVLYKKLETAQQYDEEDENESDESDSCPEQDIYDSEPFIDSSPEQKHQSIYWFTNK